MNNSNSKTFDPQTLADDLCEVQRIYANFFAGLTEADWARPVKGGPEEWNMHETVAHLCALNGDGLESIRSALQGERYTFEGLTDRYHFNAYNRRGIDDHLKDHRRSKHHHVPCRAAPHSAGSRTCGCATALEAALA